MPNRFLLVGWEAADWKILHPLLDAGKLPALQKLVETGISGDLLGCQPPVTALHWTSLATGKRTWQHGIAHNKQFDSTRQQVVPIGRANRRSATIWEMLAAANQSSIAIGWPATHGTVHTNAKVVSDRYSEPTAPPGVKPWPPAAPECYSHAGLAAKLDPLRTSPETIGTDVLSRFVPGWQKVDQSRDKRLGHLRNLLCVDFSHHNAALKLLADGNWQCAAVRYPAFGHLARLFGPLQSPRRAWITEQDFELYHEVIPAACRLLDLMLGQLVQLAGTDATVAVISPHGVRAPDFAPMGFPTHDADAWKTAYGIFALNGPNVVADGLIHGASILDVAPTVLTARGLPLANDMEGRVLLECFRTPPALTHIPTYESFAALANKTAGLDYEHPSASQIQLESCWHLAQSNLEVGRIADAAVLLQQLFEQFPERTEFSAALFQARLQLQQIPEAATVLEVLLEGLPPGAGALQPQAELALAQRHLNRARQLAQEIQTLNPQHPALLRRLGVLLLHLREWDALAELAQKAVAQDDTDAIAWLGLAAAQLRKQQPVAAETAARRAIGLKYFLPDAHFILARALVAQSKWHDASEAMAAMTQLQPQNRTAAAYARRVTQQAGLELKV